MMAMLKIHSNHRFREMGWKIIHDEIICEGPEEHTEEAMSIVRQSMQYPFKNPLLVDLTVDAKADYTWYKAK
jgi:DNA polymerase I